MNNFSEKKKYFNGLRAYIGFSTTYVNVEKNKRYKGKQKCHLVNYLNWD